MYKYLQVKRIVVENQIRCLLYRNTAYSDTKSLSQPIEMLIGYIDSGYIDNFPYPGCIEIKSVYRIFFCSRCLVGTCMLSIAWCFETTTKHRAFCILYTETRTIWL